MELHLSNISKKAQPPMLGTVLGFVYSARSQSFIRNPYDRKNSYNLFTLAA